MKMAKTSVFICLLSIFSMASDFATSYKEAAAVADEQEKASATTNYFSGTLLPYYAQKYGKVLQTCFATVNQADNSPFSFVAAIGPDGRVVRLYTDHETNLFGCVRQALIKDEFPKPPVHPYYLHIDMQFADDAKPLNSVDKAPPLVVEPNKYSYTFGVPSGWTFSFEQAQARGATLAFFPNGGSFNDSSSVIYINEIDDGCSECMNVLPQKVAETIREVRDGSPTVKVVTHVPVTTKDGGKALIRLLQGAQDPRGPKARKDNEALAFIGHDETIILVILSARETKTWERDYSAFEQIVAGHKFFNCKSPELRVPCKR